MRSDSPNVNTLINVADTTLLAHLRSGLGAWHPAKLALLWIPALALSALGANSYDSDTIVIGLILLVAAGVTTWRWLTAREIRTGARNFPLPPGQAEVVECMVWQAVTQIRRAYLLDSAFQNISIDRQQHLRQELFVGMCVATKLAIDAAVRHDDDLRGKLHTAFFMRLGALTAQGNLTVLTDLVVKRGTVFFTSYLQAFSVDELEARVNAAWRSIHASEAPRTIELLTMVVVRCFHEQISGALRPFAQRNDVLAHRATILEVEGQNLFY